MRKYAIAYVILLALLFQSTTRENNGTVVLAPTKPTVAVAIEPTCLDEFPQGDCDEFVCSHCNRQVENEKLVAAAINVCFPQAKKVSSARLNNAAALLLAEEEADIPDDMRGMTLAAACMESGFNANAEGDHSFSKDGKTPKAIGILQMWPCYEKAYGVNRRDVRSSAKGWLANIGAQVPSVRRRCKARTIKETWRLAWVHGVRAPKKGGRCNENTLHWSVFKKIRDRLLDSQT